MRFGFRGQNGSMSSLSEFSNDLVTLVAKVSPSIVAVKAGAYRTVSGVIVDETHIAVPEHALKRRDSIPLVTSTGQEAVGKVLGRDPGVDVAILQVEGLSLPSLTITETLKAGSLVAVVGMTSDVGPSFSLGTIGALGPQRRTWKIGLLDHFIRLDVTLYPSQIGAVVVDTEGHLIGMATPALSRHSTIAIPASTIHRVMAELKKDGRIRTGYLGVGVQPVAIPEHLQTKIPGSPKVGLILLNVVSGGAAEQAGLLVGDILLNINGQALEDVEQLQAQLRGENIGTPSELLVLRGGEPLKISIVIQESQRSSQ